MFQIKLSPIFLALILSGGCYSNAPVPVVNQSSGNDRIGMKEKQIEDKSVNIVATVESGGYYANAVHDETRKEPAVFAVILRVDESSVAGPGRIVIFFTSDTPESLMALFRENGKSLRFKMTMGWFTMAAFQGAVVDGSARVYVGALTDIAPAR